MSNNKINHISAVPYYIGDTDKVRYKVIDTVTGKTLDKGRHNGGYETASQALVSWSYKNWNRQNRRKKKYRQEDIRLWMKKHEEFCHNLADYNIDIWKRSHHRQSMPLDDELREMLLEEDPSIDFSIQEFKQVWKSKTSY